MDSFLWLKLSGCFRITPAWQQKMHPDNQRAYFALNEVLKGLTALVGKKKIALDGNDSKCI